MHFKTAKHVITALATLASMTSLASTQDRPVDTNITTDAAGTHFVRFRPDGGPLQVRSDVNTWTLVIQSGVSPVQATLIDANGYGVNCPVDPGQVCEPTRREGDFFVFEPSGSTPGAYTIREADSARYWVVEDGIVFPAGSVDSQVFYLNLE
ncbi:hypothetical protein BJY00DRAFT_318540 [Aspergillus carlsbadensis]|nr:hypothetical protein BJY00DRAFT_318540 [Aspergillus carlsbadensis]